MCFSKKASIVSFITGIIGSILCIQLGTILDKIIGYFMGFISFMQGIEYLIWRHQICDDYNKIISFIGMVLNNMQPIMLGIILLYYNARPQNYNWILLTIFIYFCLAVPYSMQFMKDPEKQCIIKGKKHDHLVWRWPLMEGGVAFYFVFLVSLCVLFLLGLPKLKYGIYFAIITLVSYISSDYFYPSGVTGELWCYYSAFFPIIYFIFRRLFIKL
jgi:hypothetical protein